ncbi:zinc-binding domain-domain-containing protein [Coniella lustricola]|uniref:Zinc-binding domain-domain-containing protein n=1 Tax=Coniella lustricola TaxID=2025994 RepID=A0A2T3AG99_9PEZI|nr:zinc-binding domain-domain-containing protein [Coniella lustricola]
MPPKPKPKANGNSRPKQKAWSFYPKLHDSVEALLKGDNLHFTFYPVEDGVSGCNGVNRPINEYITNIMGRFICYNPGCASHGWPSKTIAITIREYHGQRYNAAVYKQRCKSCSQLGKAVLDEQSYTERVANRLKMWHGVQVEAPRYRVQEVQRPHETELCEGCKNPY